MSILKIINKVQVWFPPPYTATAQRLTFWIRLRRAPNCRHSTLGVVNRIYKDSQDSQDSQDSRLLQEVGNLKSISKS